MEEFIFKKMLCDEGVDDVFVSSSATSTEEIWNGIGNPVYPPAREELIRHGISCDGKRAVQLTRADRDKYDMFICMDSRNLQNAKRILESDENVYKLLDFAGGGDVADPWYSGNFAVAYKDIEKGCKALLSKIKED